MCLMEERQLQRSREDDDGWEADDGHFTPEEATAALDLQLALDRGTLAVGAKIAFLKLRGVWCGCDKDLNINAGRFPVQGRALSALPVGVVRGRVDRWLVGRHASWDQTQFRVSASWKSELEEGYPITCLGVVRSQARNRAARRTKLRQDRLED